MTVWGLGDPAVDRAVLRLGPVADLTFRPDAGAPERVEEVLGRAVHLGASNVHVETYEHDVDVRFRIDGVLHQVPTPLSLENVDAFMARLKVLSDLDIAERRRSQDGRIRALYPQYPVDRGVSTSQAVLAAFLRAGTGSSFL